MTHGSKNRIPPWRIVTIYRFKVSFVAGIRAASLIGKETLKKRISNIE
jgi:hypothetical protein